MDTEYEKYKADKLIDYLKYITSLHLVVIGVMVSFKEKFLSNSEVELPFWITVGVLLFSFILAAYGYVILINSYFEQLKHHLKIASWARKWPGYILIGAVSSFIIQSFSVWVKNA